MSEKEFRNTRGDLEFKATYNEEIDIAKKARDSQFNDTNPMIEKEGFLGIDDIDRMRRRKIRKSN